MLNNQSFEGELRYELRNRLNLIIQEVPHFWEGSPYMHFTNHGHAHSERIYHQKLAQLAQELPYDQRLIQDEIYIVSAAAWLYEIGMQSTSLSSVLDYKYQPDTPFTFEQLQRIREHRGQLTQRLIIDNVRGEASSASLRLGLTRPADDYTQLIAEVCSGCSNKPLEDIPETLPVNAVDVRLRLMVALLRLADQLYIDSPRVNLDMLQVVPLPLKEKMRWWAYHYTQALPIIKGRIRFHYFLPLAYKPLLGHIRALVEPDFEYDHNPTIRYLWDKHGIRLTLHKSPTVRFDQPDGFQREMNPEMVAYLRRYVTPIKPLEKESDEEDKKGEEGNLLILDYENLLLERGLAGKFFSTAEVGRLFITFLIEASKQLTGSVDGLAVGHWDRPDLASVALMLKEKVYKLLTVADHEKVSEVVVQELQRVMQADNPPQHILLVAPRQEMAASLKPILEKKLVSAWISDSPDDIYQAIMRGNVKSLASLPGFSTDIPFDLVQHAIDQAACILRLERHMDPALATLSYQELYAALKQLEAIRLRVEWWHLRLIQQKIVLPKRVNEGYLFQLNAEHPAVVKVCDQRRAVIEALQTLVQSGQGVAQSLLVSTLVDHALFQDDCELQEPRDCLLQFLKILNEEGTIHVDGRPSAREDQHLWYLNTTDAAVVRLNAPRYLPLFALGLDHFLAREAFPVIHEHALARRLALYVEESIVDAVYQLACQRQWVERQDVQHLAQRDERNRVSVWLSKDQKEVRAVLLNRNVLLDTLYRRARVQKLTRDGLWSFLGADNRFTLKPDEVDAWLAVFQRDTLLHVTPDEHNRGRDCIQLNLNSLLLHRLLGSMHLWGVVLTLRLMGATHPDRRKPLHSAISFMAKVATHGNQELAGWALAYAKSIKLVEYGTQSTPDGDIDVLHLKKHNFVFDLDKREPAVCQALAMVVCKQAQRRSRDGWLPRPMLLQAMEEDSCFGTLQGEYEYWINQAVHRRLLDLRTERQEGRAPQNYLRVRTKESL